MDDSDLGDFSTGDATDPSLDDGSSFSSPSVAASAPAGTSGIGDTVNSTLGTVSTLAGALGGIYSAVTGYTQNPTTLPPATTIPTTYLYLGAGLVAAILLVA